MSLTNKLPVVTLVIHIKFNTHFVQSQRYFHHNIITWTFVSLNDELLHTKYFNGKYLTNALKRRMNFCNYIYGNDI